MTCTNSPSRLSIQPKRLLRSLWWFVCVLLYGGVLIAQADEQIRILSVRSQTADLVEFRITLPKSNYVLGEDVVVLYLVKNNGEKPIYLVVEPESRLAETKVEGLLLVKSPIRAPLDHIECKCELVKILPKKSFSGKLKFKGGQIPADKEYSSEFWEIQVGFAYLFDVSNLLDCKEFHDLHCLKELSDKAKSLVIGNLVIEVKNN